jgi:hypothetical protein
VNEIAACTSRSLGFATSERRLATERKKASRRAGSNSALPSSRLKLAIG